MFDEFISICRNGYVIGYQHIKCKKLCIIPEDHNCDEISTVSFASNPTSCGRLD